MRSNLDESSLPERARPQGLDYGISGRGYHWAVIGTGAIAHDMASAYHRARGPLYGVCGTSWEKAKRFATECDVLVAYESCDEMLADPEVDIVYIATPHNLHYHYIKQAVLAGKHVLCEKAITVSIEELEEVLELARKKGVVVMEAMTLFHMPLYRRLRELVVERQAIGKVKMISVNFGSCKEADAKNRFFNPDLAGGALLDIGTYAVAFARYFLDRQPDTVLSTVTYYETGVDEESGILLQTSCGQMAVIALSMRAKQPKRGVVAGELGYIEVEDYPRATEAVVVYTADGRRETVKDGKKADALLYEVEDMEDAVSRADPDVISLSRDVMELLSRVSRQWSGATERDR